MTILGWSMAEFWAATPVTLHNQLAMHKKAHRQKGKGGKREAKKVRYADEMPSNAW